MDKDIEMQQQQNQQPPPYPPAYSAHDNSGFSFAPEASVSYPQQQQQTSLFNPAFNSGPGYGFSAPTHFSAQPQPFSTMTTTAPPVDRLTQILNQTEELVFVQTDSISIFGRTTIMIPIHDSRGHPLLSIVHTPGQTIRRDDRMDIHLGSLTILNDPTGNLLVTAKEGALRSLTVTSGDVTLGSVDGWGPWAFNVSARNSMGQQIFSVVERGGGEHIFLGSDGTEIGTLRKSNGSVSLRLKPGLDPKVKSLVVIAAFMLFLYYFAQTSCGAGLRRGLWCFMGTGASVMLTFIIIMIIIFVVVF